jgi:hypothetical protein
VYSLPLAGPLAGRVERDENVSQGLFRGRLVLGWFPIDRD